MNIKNSLLYYEYPKINKTWKIANISLLPIIIKYYFFKKFTITYTGRIYKIFFKKKFIKMNFNRAHKTIYKYKFPKLYFRHIPFDKNLLCYCELPFPYKNTILSKLINIRQLNYYTWRGLKLSYTPWTKKPGKISEYV